MGRLQPGKMAVCHRERGRICLGWWREFDGGSELFLLSNFVASSLDWAAYLRMRKPRGKKAKRQAILKQRLRDEAAAKRAKGAGASAEDAGAPAEQELRSASSRSEEDMRGEGTFNSCPPRCAECVVRASLAV